MNIFINSAPKITPDTKLVIVIRIIIQKYRKLSDNLIAGFLFYLFIFTQQNKTRHLGSHHVALVTGGKFKNA